MYISDTIVTTTGLQTTGLQTAVAQIKDTYMVFTLNMSIASMQPCINPCSCHYSERPVTAQKKRNKPGNGLKLCWEEMCLVINVEQTMSTRSCVMEKSLWSKCHILLGLYHDPPIILLIRERQHYFMVNILMSSHFSCV